MAEYYSAELSQKVTRNLELNASKGLFNGGPTPFGYKIVTVHYDGYDKKKYEIDPETAPIVKEIYEMRANDEKLEDIANYLNEKGYKTAYGKEFKKTSLERILRNKRYIGTNTYKDLEFPNTIPAIIDKELFDRVQEIVNKYRYAPAIAKAKEEYILTTKLFCGHCKAAMTGTCGTSQNGTIYYYYICNNQRTKKCKKKAVSKSKIEDEVIKKCRELLTDENINIIANKVYQKCQKENLQSCLMKSLEREIKQLEKSIENILVAIESGQNVDLFNERLTQKRCELQNTKIKLDKEKGKLVNLTEEAIKFFLEDLKSGNIDDIKYRKTLIAVFVNRIYLYDDKLTIIMNVGNKKVTVNSSLLQEINTNLKKTSSLFLDKLGEPIKRFVSLIYKSFFMIKNNKII